MNEQTRGGGGPQITVVGVGHGGAATVGRLARDWPDGPRTVILGTDREMLAQSPVPASDRLLIGESQARGLSTGGNVDLGRAAAESGREAIQGILAGEAMVFLVGGLGGGLATGALPVLARQARAFGALTVCLVTLPFDFEGRACRNRAEQGLTALQAAADVVIVVPNEKLVRLMGGQARVAEAFSRADAVLGRALYSVWRMISRPGLISLDYADLHALLAGSSGLGAFGYGDGSGPNKAREAADMLMSNPLLNQGHLLHGAEAVLVSIAGGPDLTLQEIDTIMKPIREALRPDAHLAMGTVVDDAWRDRLTVTVLVSEKWRQDPSGQMELGLDGAVDPAPPAAAGDARKRRTGAIVQGSLLLGGGANERGRFKDVAPTVEDGQNLDTPTFIRRGIPI